MLPSTRSSGCGITSSTTVDPLAVLRDPTAASDAEITVSMLLIWCDASAPVSLHDSTTHISAMRRAASHILGYKSPQSAEALRRRYRQLAMRVHPDKNASPQASEAFKVLQICFEYALEQCELEAPSRVGAQEQAGFPCAADPPVSEKRDTYGRGVAVRGGVAKSHFSSSTSSSSSSSSPSSSTFSASSSSLSPPLSPPFKGGSSSSGSRLPSGVHRYSAAAAKTSGLGSSAFTNPPPQVRASVPRVGSHRSTQSDHLNVFFTAGGAATVPPPSVFGESSCSPAMSPPPPIFDAKSASEGVSATPLTHCVRHRVSTGVDTQFTGATTNLSQDPPILFDCVSATPLTPHADSMADSAAEATRQDSLQQKQGAQGKELPTLAELLAWLDAVDDEDQGTPGRTETRAGGVSPRDDIKGFGSPRFRSHKTAATTASLRTHGVQCFPKRHPDSSRSLKDPGSNGNRDGADATLTRLESIAAVPVHVDMWTAAAAFGAPALTSSTLATFSSALQEEVRHVHGRHCSPPHSFPQLFSSRLTHSSVRSRRAGGGGVAGTGAGITNSSRCTFGGERCACGKALRGRCFLCEG